MTTTQHLDDDVLAAHALSALEPLEAEEATRHLATCEECLRRLADVRSLLLALPESVTDLSPPPNVKVGLLERVRTDDTSQLRQNVDLAAPVPIQRTRRWSYQMPGLALAASLLVAALIGAIASGLIAGNDSSNEGLLQALTGQTEGLVLPMKGTEVAPDVRAALLAPDGVERVFVVASNVPPPPAGQTYNLYLYEGGTATLAATLQPDARGRVSAVLDAPLSRFDAMELNIQPVGTTSPGGPAVLKSTLP